MSCVPLSTVAHLNPAFLREAGEENDTRVSFVPMAGVSEETGRIAAIEERSLRDVTNGFSYFQTNDVLVAKITPCFENGKIALVEIPNRHGFGSTEFHVLRAKSQELDGRYLFHFLRQDWVRLEGERKMTGSAGQRRVPRYFLESLEIPLVSLPEQRRIAEVLDRAEALRAKRRAALAQLMRSRNRSSSTCSAIQSPEIGR